MDAELRQFLEAMERRAEQREREQWKSLDQRVQQLQEYIDHRSQQLRTELTEYIDERTHDAETRIVRAFGAYQQSSSIRFRKLESDLSNVNASTTEQMDAFQSKLLELETRIINLEKPQGSAA
jgi:isocitrate dehydrogenase kinase/phosphatase